MRGEFLLADVRIRPGLLRFEFPDATVSVEPKVMDAVVYLASRAGDTVTRQSMMAALWPDVHVSDDALNRCIWKLRRALGDDRDAARFLATIPKRGYRLVAPVVWVDVGSDAVPNDTTIDAGKARLESGTPPRFGGLFGFAIVLAALVVGLVALSTLAIPSGTATSPEFITRPGDRYEPLTSLNGYESAPVVSPDGKTVAFHHYRHDGAHPDQFDLMIQATVPGDGPRYLVETAANDVFPAWSPDAAKLAYVRSDARQCDLVVRTMATGAEVVATPCDPTVWSGPAWRSDGAALFFAARESGQGPSRIVQLSLRDGARVRLTDPPQQDEGDSQPTPSPDGRHLAFIRARSDRISDIYVMPLSGGPTRRLTFDAGQVGGLAWSAAGDQIVFSSDRLGPFRLWAVPLAGGDPVSVPTVGDNASAPAVSGAGPALVYEEWKSTIDVRTVRLREPGVQGLAPFEARPLITSTQWDMEARWSPDGTRLAFLSNRTGSTEVWLAESDGASPRRATSIGAQFSSWLRWSPDGSRLAFAAPVGDQLDIHVLQIETGVLTRATFDASDERWPAWSPDGRWLYFGSNRGGQWDVWRQSVEGGDVTAVTSTGGLAPAVSSDGTELYYARAGARGVWRTRLGSGSAGAPLVGVVPSGPASWDVRNHAVYFVTQPRTGGPPLLSRHDLSTGATAVVAPLESPDGGYPEWFQGSGISVSVDERRVAYSSIERSDSDLWIVRRRR